MSNKRLERTRRERASLLSCVGEPLKRNVRPQILIVLAHPETDKRRLQCNDRGARLGPYGRSG